MEIVIPNSKLKAALEDDSECQRRFGKGMVRPVRSRMEALDAAESLADFWPPKTKPERIHELAGREKGIFTADLQQPFRLLFRPMNESAPDAADQLERWRGIKGIEIIGVEDTHG